jgi:hypothetical protein
MRDLPALLEQSLGRLRADENGPSGDQRGTDGHAP